MSGLDRPGHDAQIKNRLPFFQDRTPLDFLVRSLAFRALFFADRGNPDSRALNKSTAMVASLICLVMAFPSKMGPLESILLRHELREMASCFLGACDSRGPSHQGPFPGRGDLIDRIPDP